MVQDIFLKRTLNVIRNVDKFLKKPEENYLHEIRTESRKLESLFMTLGELSGSKEYKEYLRKLKQLIRLFSPSRETDVCIQITEEYLKFKTDNSLVIKFLDNLKTLSVEQRRRIFVNKKLVDFLLSKATLEDFIRNKMFSSAGEITPEKVSKYLGVQVCFLYDKMMIYKDDVLSGPENMKQLHKMRLRAKPLRYTLDFLNEVLGLRLSDVGNKIKTMVALAGEIHDYDMVIDKAEKFESLARQYQNDDTDKDSDSSVSVFINHLKNKRFQDYTKFKSLVLEIDSEKDKQGFIII
ncbi:MAG: CHAD domain-containing protein [Candidatus Kapaibacterium sp.]